ncbi:MAG: SDR family NAD(P)-dependent oxidoreductase [Gammaproteobacteria bacterium]|jgi:3-oxoacyl-[acyl-carrier protein] reductase|nr:SDR family NAD(P)-dependent oxidoreductase [Gammaproteobacteria bacterium]
MTQDRALQDKVVLITGAARGIGASAALALANRGAYVHVTDVLDCAATVGQIEAAGGQAEAHHLDVTDRAACQALADAIRAKHGHLDILVCNAGVCPEGTVAGDWEQWERVIDINLHGTQNCIAAVYDGMKQTGYGRIVIVSSMAYYQGGLIVGSEYSASKAAVIGLTRHIARNAGQYGINVNAVAPGVIETDMTANFEKPEFDRIPVRRYGTAEDVAGPISFLCGPESAFMTGTVLNVTGGQVIAG